MRVELGTILHLELSADRFVLGDKKHASLKHDGKHELNEVRGFSRENW